MPGDCDSDPSYCTTDVAKYSVYCNGSDTCMFVARFAWLDNSYFQLYNDNGSNIWYVNSKFANASTSALKTLCPYFRDRNILAESDTVEACQKVGVSLQEVN